MGGDEAQISEGELVNAQLFHRLGISMSQYLFSLGHGHPQVLKQRHSLSLENVCKP